LKKEERPHTEGPAARHRTVSHRSLAGSALRAVRGRAPVGAGSRRRDAPSRGRCRDRALRPGPVRLFAARLRASLARLDDPPDPGSARPCPVRSVSLRATRSGPFRVVARTITLVAALAWVGWAPAPPAAAHGELLFSGPAEGAVVETLPSRARLTFSDTVAEIRQITVVGPDGSVANGDPTSIGPEVSQTLWVGSDGEYVMEYFVVSADGHDVRGEVHFVVDSGDAVAGNGGSVGSDDRASAAVTAEDRWWQRGRAAGLPLGLVLLATVAALALLHRRRHAATDG
jgi:copper resistance protein C